MERRSFIRLTGTAAGAVLSGACGRSVTGVETIGDKIHFRDMRIPLGISIHSPLPADAPFEIVRVDAVRAYNACEGKQLLLIGPYEHLHENDEWSTTHDWWQSRNSGEQLVEVWNEPNLPDFWGGEPDPDAYVEQVRLCRDLAPRARMIGPSVGGGDIDWPFLERCAKVGLTRYLDVIGVHPYGVGAPEALRPFVNELRRLFPGKPIAVTEWGFVHGPEQADLIRRAMEVSSACGLEFLILYSYMDAPDGPAQGLYNSDGTPRPAADVIRELVRR